MNMVFVEDNDHMTTINENVILNETNTSIVNFPKP